MSRSGIVIVDRWIDTKRSTPLNTVLLTSSLRSPKETRYRARAWDHHAPPSSPGGRVGRYKDKCFPTIREAQEWALNERVNFSKGVASAVTTTMPALGELYLESQRNRIGKPVTLRHQQQTQQVIDGIIQAGGHDVTHPSFPDLVQRWLSRLQVRRHRKSTPRPASMSLQCKFLTIARSIMNYARKRRFIAYNPLEIITTARQPVLRRQVFTVAELRQLVSDDSRIPGAEAYAVATAKLELYGNQKEAAKALGIAPSTLHYRLAHPPAPDPWWMATVLCTYLGCRISTAIALTPHQVNLARKEINIPAIFPGNKTRLEMLVPIQPELHDILTEVLGQPQVAMDMPLVGAHFLTYTTSNLTNGFKDYVRRVGIDRREPWSSRTKTFVLLTHDADRCQSLCCDGHGRPCDCTGAFKLYAVRCAIRLRSPRLATKTPLLSPHQYISDGERTRKLSSKPQ